MTDWEKFQNMTPAEQERFYASFSDPMDFFEWQIAAKAEYDAAHPSIEIGPDGSIELG